MKQGSNFYNNPLIIEGVSAGRFYFSKIYSLFNAIKSKHRFTCLLVNKVNGKWTICPAFQRERERERSGYDDEKGYGRL